MLHQLDRTSIEALEDWTCGNFESELLVDEKMPYGFICDHPRLFHEFISPSYYRVVHLGTYVCRSAVQSHVMVYHEP
jgi:hypothetical protein